MLPPGGIPLSRRVYLPEYEFLMGFAGLENCEYLKQLRSPRKLRILANFGHPARLDSSENVEQTRTTKNNRTQKGNVGNIEDATQLQKAKNT